MITPLDPVIAEIIPLLPLRDPKTMTPQSARDALRALAASRAAVPPPPVMSAEDIKVKGAAGFLAARVYRNTSEKSPTVVFFHGGGWVAGDLETHDRQARLLAIETGAVVVSVDYRRPPEVRFPGAFEDAFAAIKDVVARIAEFGGDSSASASPATAPAATWRRPPRSPAATPASALAAQLLVYPVTDVAGNFADAERERALSLAQRKRGRLFPVARGHGMVLRPLPRQTAAHGTDWRVSPLRAKTLAGLAPAIVTHGVVRSAARRGQGLCRRASTRRRRRPAIIDGLGLIHGYFGLGEASGDRQRRGATRARRFQGFAGSGARVPQSCQRHKRLSSSIGPPSAAAGRAYAARTPSRKPRHLGLKATAACGLTGRSTQHQSSLRARLRGRRGDVGDVLRNPVGSGGGLLHAGGDFLRSGALLFDGRCNRGRDLVHFHDRRANALDVFHHLLGFGLDRGDLRADFLGGLGRLARQRLDLACDDGKAACRPRRPARASMVALSASKLVCDAMSLIEADHFADLVGGDRKALNGLVGALAVISRLVGNLGAPVRRAG